MITIQSFHLILADIGLNSTLTPNLSRYFVSSDASEFGWLPAIAIGVAFFVICVANYALLHRHVISKAVLRADRRYKFLRESRTVSAFRQPAWVRIAAHILLTTGVPVLLYACASSEFRLIIGLGLVGAIAFVLFHAWLALREVLHPRSTHNRRYLFFRSDAAFVKVRLLFGLVRRYTYIVFGWAVVTYVFHRLDPQAFTMQSLHGSTFLLHLESALNGLTRFAVEPLSANSPAGTFLLLARGTFGVLGVLWLGNLLLAGLTSAGEQARRSEFNLLKFHESPVVSVLNPSQETEANVISIISSYLCVSSKDIKPESELTSLGADSLDVMEVLLILQEFFERELTKEEVVRQFTVRDLIQLFEEPKSDTAAKERPAKPH